MTTDAESLAAAAADECRRILEEKDRLLTAARDERDAARADARRLKGIIQCLSLGAANRDAYVSHAMLCHAIRYGDSGIGPCACGYTDVAAVMTECSACPRPAREDGLCDPCHGIVPAPVPPGETTPPRDRCERCRRQVMPQDFTADEPVICLECAAPAAHPETTPKGNDHE